MKRFTMMMNERRLASLARFSGKTVRAHVAGLILPFAGAALIGGTASAADATHPQRLHHTAAQSAGSADTRGKVQPAKPSSKREESAAVRRRGKQAKPARSRENEDVAPARSRARSRRRRHEPEVVDDPIVMLRASSKAKSRKVSQQQTAMQHPTEPQAPAAEKKVLTVDDFVRAAGGSASAQPVSNVAPAANASSTPGEVYAQGVSHPDEYERMVTNDVPADLPKPKQPTMQKPAPIVRAAGAKASSSEIAVAGVNYDDAPQPDDVPQSKVVQGFGGEVEVLPSTPAAHSRTASATRHTVAAKADEISPEAKAAEREATDDAVKLMVVPLYARNGRLIVPPPLKGTREILVHQNTMADDEGLSRIQDDEDLNRMRAQHLLVPFPEMAALDVNDELPVNRRYARPWTVKFATDTARAFYARFHEPLHLNSAVRTVDYQLRLMRVNGNAAAVDGDTASPHLTGQAIDLGKRGMSVAEIAWMRAYLLPLMQAGKVDVEEEFQQACFHISVYESYGPKKKVMRTEVAMVKADSRQ